MALEIDEKENELAKKNQFIVVDIFNVDLNDGRTLYLTNNNGNVHWSGNDYLAFPVSRDRTSQEGSERVSDNTIVLGDSGHALTKEIFNNLSVILNAFVTIHQQRASIEGTVLLGFRQIYRGRVGSVSASQGIIEFTVIAPFFSPQKPANDKKWGEFFGMRDAFRKIN